MKKEQQINSSSVISKMGSTTKMIQKLHKIAFKPHIQSVMNLFKLKLFYKAGNVLDDSLQRMLLLIQESENKRKEAP